MDSKMCIAVYKNGQYYNPALKHYNNKPGVVVICDNCKDTNLKTSIGWLEFDLCLSCVASMDENVIKPISSVQPLTQMKQSQFLTNMEQSQFLTKMVQSQFKRPLTKVVTRMVQSQFNPEDLSYMEQEQFNPY